MDSWLLLVSPFVGLCICWSLSLLVSSVGLYLYLYLLVSGYVVFYICWSLCVGLCFHWSLLFSAYVGPRVSTYVGPWAHWSPHMLVSESVVLPTSNFANYVDIYCTKYIFHVTSGEKLLVFKGDNFFPSPPDTHLPIYLYKGEGHRNNKNIIHDW